MATDPADHYSPIAPDYAEKNRPDHLPDAFFELRDTFEDRLENGAAVLDVGCGDGRDVHHFARQGYDPVGIDIAPGMVEYAREHRDGRYETEDMRDLPFSADHFDAAWCCTSIFLLPHEEQPVALEELYRVLNDDGLLYIGFKTAPEPDAHPRDEFGSTVLQYRIPTTQAETMLREAGFTVERLPDSVNPDGYGLANFFGTP